MLLLARRGVESDRTLRYLEGRHVDGAMIISHHQHDRLAQRLADIGLPCVFGGRPWSDGDRVTYVDVDNEAGGRIAAEALLERGCTKIGTIAGPRDMTAAVDRLAGWRSAMQQAGLPDDRVSYGDFTEPGGEEATRELLEAHPDIDGLFVASDLMAAGALTVLAGMGRSIPDDVAVVGFDDIGVAERTSPPLTTMKNPVREMSELGTRMLLEQIRGQASGPMRVIMPTALVRRQSC